MGDFYCRKSMFAISLGMLAVVAGCSTPPPSKPPSPGQCQAARADDALIGKWLAVRKQKGITGELRLLFTLKADGTMAYDEQLRRGKKPPQGLHETGCWRHDDQELVLKTTESNGGPVDASDPIYINGYQILEQTGQSLSLQGPDASITARRMPAHYHLPY